jgi:hypothetical protein
MVALVLKVWKGLFVQLSIERERERESQCEVMCLTDVK